LTRASNDIPVPRILPAMVDFARASAVEPVGEQTFGAELPDG
jgi:hypothetical protein